VADGRGRQQGGPHRDRDDQGGGAQHGLPGDRLGDAGARRRRHVSDDFPLAYAYANARTLRFADGPDEVHRNAIAKWELGRASTITRTSGSVPLARISTRPPSPSSASRGARFRPASAALSSSPGRRAAAR
jgi:hypothetical protein